MTAGRETEKERAGRERADAGRAKEQAAEAARRAEVVARVAQLLEDADRYTIQAGTARSKLAQTRRENAEQLRELALATLRAFLVGRTPTYVEQMLAAQAGGKLVSSGSFYKGLTRDLQSPVQRENPVTYTPGTTVYADRLNENPETDCGAGINFSRTVAEALRWGPVVVRLDVPASERIIDAGRKLRARTARVVEIVDLTGADLTGAYLAGAYLAGANLVRADLTGANLAGAYLAGAYLAGANLAGANLAGANLTDAYLTNADLVRADLTGANLAGAIGLPVTGIPEGWAIDKAGIWRRGGPS